MFGKNKVKEIVVSISETITITAVYYDDKDEELKNLNWIYANSGLTFTRIGYRKVKRFKVDSIKHYNNGNTSVLISGLFETKEEAEEVYNQLLESNGETYIENIIDKKTFKK